MNETETIPKVNMTQAMQLSSHQVVEQVQLIQQVLKSVMKQDEHYGVIPGTKKPSLLKAGAEKLCLTFRLAPFYKIERIDHKDFHREFIVTASLTHIPTGNQWGEGVGSCSTMEKKYRYRKDKTPTGRKVPKEYWDSRDQSLLGGKGFVASKDGAGTWMIYQEEQAENPDIAETYNTVLKMAKKRALVDATINACAASDIFTQDLEDFKPDENSNPNAELHAKLLAEHIDRIKKLPKDIQNGFKLLKPKLGKGLTDEEYYAEVVKVIETNESDPERIKSWIAEKGRESGEMVKQNEEGMP